MADEDKEAGAEHPLDPFMAPERRERLESVLAHRTDHLTIVLDQVQNYHNISAVLRSADAFGITTVHLIGDAFEYSRTISLGAENWIVLKRYKTSVEAAAALKREGYKLVVLRPKKDESDTTNLPIFSLPFTEKLALVFGNEKDGVSAELAHEAEIAAHIPMFGFVESLNVSVACAITLFCSSIGHVDGKRGLPELPPALREELKDRWFKKSVRRSEEILREIEKRNSN
jgi:tRNA (guanosine-2'-O-)-methyltransferase